MKYWPRLLLLEVMINGTQYNTTQPKKSVEISVMIPLQISSTVLLISDEPNSQKFAEPAPRFESN